MIKVVGKTNKKGFSLIELAIVLVVVGVVMMIGIMGFMRVMETINLKRTSAAVDGDVQDVVLFSTKNRRIMTSAEFLSLAKFQQDAFDKNIMYIPAVNLSDLTLGDICARKTSGLTVQNCGFDTGCIAPDVIADVAFVVVSGGINQNIQIKTTTPVQIFDTGATSVDLYAGDGTTAEEFDDYVKLVTLKELKANLVCEEVPLKIVNSRVPVGYENNPYSVVFVAEGGVEFPVADGGKYQWCVETESGSLSANLSRNPSGVPVTDDCSAATFVNADELEIHTAGTDILTSFGTFAIKIYVQDNDGNSTSKEYVITINPEYKPASGS